ncbi:hypothetical protein D7X25_16565 [bacterium 1XD42-8]|jgi:vancomycin resistance protein YoaR|nr:hypothetical protein D7X25_16565 [bacterium 1XD42-8]
MLKSKGLQAIERHGIFMKKRIGIIKFGALFFSIAMFSSTNIHGGEIQQVDPSVFLQAMEAAAAQGFGATRPFPEDPISNVPVLGEAVDPNTLLTQAYSNNTLAGTYTTSFSGSSSNRINNIQVAADRINNMVIAPGQEVSFSQTILPRTAANGYKKGGAYVGGKVVSVTGGGICQVSSTLYAALMNAGVTVTERHPHSMTVGYLPLGMDATIAGTSKDLKFLNNYNMPVYIQTSVEGSNLTVNVYVSPVSLGGRSYKFWSDKTGVRSADSYLTTYFNGVEVSTTFIATSRYMPKR